MTQPTQLAAMQTSAVATNQQRQNVAVSMTNLDGFELAQRCARLLSSSTLVPKEYQGNLSNCVIALNMAQRIGADPLQVMQNLVIVHGKPTWSSQFLIATVNTSGRFSALRFEFFGEQGQDTWGCRAWAIDRATGEKLVGSDITIAISKAEGWYGKNGSKWKTMPQQMLMYRAGAWWTRAFAPELSMGLQTSDEVGDVFDAQQDANGNYTINDLRNKEPETPAVISNETVDTETGEIVTRQPEAETVAEDPATDVADPATTDGLDFE